MFAIEEEEVRTIEVDMLESQSCMLVKSCDMK